MSSFSDLPPELLSNISDRLGLIDLLSFRGVCRSTRSASLNSSAAIESSSESPSCFLLSGDGDSPHFSTFIVINNNNNKGCYNISEMANSTFVAYNIHLAEMANSTCVASLDGWLLFLSPDSFMFFFCPFSRSKINLPTNCPFALHDLHFAAAFSHSPTHTDCSVVVLRRNSNDSLQLCLLNRGDSEWRWYQYNCPISKFKKTMSVTHYQGAFHFLDNTFGVVVFHDKLKSWSNNVGPPIDEDDEDGVVVTNKELLISITMFGTSEEMKSVLGIKKACCISICGTLILRTRGSYHMIPYEKKLIYPTQDDDTHRRQFKGVSIQPRFHQISPNQSW